MGRKGPESPLQSDSEAPTAWPAAGDIHGCQVVEGESLGINTRAGAKALCRYGAPRECPGTAPAAGLLLTGLRMGSSGAPTGEEQGKGKEDPGRRKWRWSGSRWREDQVTEEGVG